MEGKYRRLARHPISMIFKHGGLNIPLQRRGGENAIAHSLNSTAIPTPRILVSLIENYQQEDGSIVIPEALPVVYGEGQDSQKIINPTPIIV